MTDSKACNGEATLEFGDFQECVHCGMQVRWDLVSHPFFGFQNCREKSRLDAEAQAGEATTACITKANKDSDLASQEHEK